MPTTVTFPHDLDVHGTTDLDVAAAIAADRPFPDRPGGAIDLGHIGLSTRTGAPIVFDAASGRVTAEFSVGVAASIGVFGDLASAFAALAIGDTPGLRLATAAPPDARYALLSSSYTATGSVSANHPVGALGRVSIGAAGSNRGLLAVLHRFRRDEGARSVLAAIARSWALPSSVAAANVLEPETWLVGEIDGSLAVNLAGAVGYSMDFVRTAAAGTLTGDIGLKIDAALKATFGLDVTGRFLLVVGRESTDERVRVQLFKLSRRGLTFGLNLKVGVTGVETLTPDTIDDFVAAVFGVHGTQIVDALQQLDRWTDPSRSIGDFVAGLVDSQAQALFTRLTHKDLRTEFAAARAMVMDALHRWEDLAPEVSSELWMLVGRLGPEEENVLRDGLTLLASTDDAAQRRAFESLLADASFVPSPLAKLLHAAADRGLLELVNRGDDLRALAANILAILDAGVIKELQQYVERDLNLAKVLTAVTQTDFDALDGWLVGRLGLFFEKTLHLEDLETVKASINAVLAQRQKLYSQLTKALDARYGFDLAASWQRTTADTAVFDVEFDTTAPAGRDLLTGLLQRSDFDRLLTAPNAAARIRTGVLTHELTRKTTVNVTLPHVDMRTDTINRALARVSADASGSGVLLYEASADDVVDAKGRFRSSLSVGLAMAVARDAGSNVRVHSRGGTWSYELLFAASGVRRVEFEAMTRPFLGTYMGAQFTGGTTLSDWYRQLDDAVEARLHNGPDTFGDLCAAFEVTVPSAALAAWFEPGGSVNAMALALQRSLKDVVAFYYVSDATRFATLGSAAALLTWASIPASNALVGDEVIWDARDTTQLARMTSRAVAPLAARLPGIRLRLEAAGRHDVLPFYAEDQAAIIVQTALGSGRPLLDNLLSFERAIVTTAADAYVDAQAFLRDRQPSSALDRLARFGSEITRAFNTLAGASVFVGPAFRPIAQSTFIEAARAFDSGVAERPSAMFTLSVLNPTRTFDIGTFSAGKLPPADQIALGQRLVSLA